MTGNLQSDICGRIIGCPAQMNVGDKLIVSVLEKIKNDLNFNSFFDAILQKKKLGEEENAYTMQGGLENNHIL